MRPVPTDETNHTYKLPGGTDENDLPARLDQGRVYSTWQLEDGELEEITPGLPRLIVSLIWPNPLGCSIKIGDGGADENPEAVKISHAGAPCWQYQHILTDRELSVLADGARIEIMVDCAPPPPMQVQFA